MTRPNFLILMADQMACSAMAVHGGPAKQPHLEALAAEAVIFDNAYCNAPLCAPSRYAFMSGRLPSRIGAYDNAADFAGDIPTFAHYLRARGYRTTLSGKMHFAGADQLHGFEERLTTDIYPADYGWYVDWDNPDIRPSWYHNLGVVEQAGPVLRSNQLDFDEETVFEAERHLHDLARGRDGRPFCLVVSMTHPHDPYATPPEFWDLYRDDEIPAPAPAPAEQDPHSRRLQRVIGLPDRPIGEDLIRRARRAYYGSCSYVDDRMGRLLDIARRTGLADNTVVIVVGDHGDMLGGRDLWFKMSWFEDSARVPLIVHAPAHFAPKRVGQAVSLIDLLPTLCELADEGGAPEYATEIEGRSLLPHLSGTGGHDEAIGEYMGEGAVAPLLMIRRDRWKFVSSDPDPDQLFDLREDPGETVNLAGRAEHRATLDALRGEADARWDRAGLRQAVLDSQHRRRLVHGALMRGRHTPWDWQPLRPAAEAYMRNHRDLDDVEAGARMELPEKT